jgi:hypothetical protein
VISLGLLAWVHKALEKIMKGFLWTCPDMVQGGKCLMAWDKVQRSLDLGGLGILDHKRFSQALRLRWLWLHHMDPSRSWSTLPCPEDQAIIAFFQASTNVVLGDDHKFRF